MRSIALGLGLGLTLVALAPPVEAQTGTGTGFAAADTVTAYRGLERLQPGVPVRARYAACGDTLRPITELTGTFVEFQPGEAFEMDVVEGNRTLVHQVAVDDLLSIEVGTLRRATTRGGTIGAVGGALLGIAGAAIGASGGDAEYGTGAAIGGALGAGLGLFLGYHSQAIQWEELPLYGPAYCGPPANPD